jgi:diacylglycerol O-acyltransferase
MNKSLAVAPMQLPRRMAATDALFWYAETAMPIFRPIIAGLYILASRPRPQTMIEAHRVAMAIVPRLRQRVVETPMSLPVWADDAHFDGAYHIRQLSVPPPGGMRELLDLTAALFATPLDRERPLWEAYCIDGLTGGRSAYFFKMHHSLVDGVGSVALLRAFTQPRSQGLPRVRRALPQPPVPAPRDLAGALLDGGREVAALVWRAAGLPMYALQAPRESTRQMLRLARAVRGLWDEMGAPPVSDPLVRSTSGLSRRFDTFDVPLARLGAIKARLGVTINDLVLAALSGALRAYHRERRVHAEALTCMVPMSLRGRDESDALGNRVGVFNIQLPVGEARQERRLERIVRQTQTAKADKRGTLYPFLVESLTFLPAAAFRWLAQHSLGRVNVACTNIPGLTEQRYMCGARIEAIYPFASVVQGTPLVVALFSYAGTMHIGIDTDPEAIPDPHRVSELFLGEIENIARGARVRAPARAADDRRPQVRAS